MKKTSWLVLVVVLTLMVAEGISWGTCDRCDDSHLACTGDHVSKIVEKCGEPAEVLKYYNAFGVLVEYVYVYPLGSGQFDRYLRFDASSSQLIGIGKPSQRR
jgi:hypothetical protein